MVECLFTNYVVVGSSPVAVTQRYEIGVFICLQLICKWCQMTLLCLISILKWCIMLGSNFSCRVQYLCQFLTQSNLPFSKFCCGIIISTRVKKYTSQFMIRFVKKKPQTLYTIFQLSIIFLETPSSILVLALYERVMIQLGSKSCSLVGSMSY